MVFPGNDEYDDKTLGAPGAPKSPSSPPNARKTSPPLKSDLGPIRPPIGKPARPESRPLSGADADLNTLLPPSVPQARSPVRSASPTPPPEASPGRPREPVRPPSSPSPQNFATAWPIAPPEASQPESGSNFDPDWGVPDERSELGTALGPPTGAAFLVRHPGWRVHALDTTWCECPGESADARASAANALAPAPALAGAGDAIAGRFPVRWVRSAPGFPSSSPGRSTRFSR